MQNLNTRQKILIGIMFVVIAYAIYDFLPKGGTEEGLQQGTVQPGITAIIPGTLPDSLKQANVGSPGSLANLDLEWRRDPFFRNTVQPVFTDTTKRVDPLSAYVYSGVIGKGDNAIATINGEFYRKGEKLGQYTIFSIHENFIILCLGDQKFNLRAKR